MHPINFPKSNTVFGANQPEYLPLPACRVSDVSGTIITCWKLSAWERLKLLFTGKIWSQSMTFNQPIQPQYLTVHYPFVEAKA